MVKKNYIDTSVLAGIRDEEFREFAESFFEEIRLGINLPVDSKPTLEELKSALQIVKKRASEIIKLAEAVSIMKKAIQEYLKEGCFSKRKEEILSLKNIEDDGFGVSTSLGYRTKP